MSAGFALSVVFTVALMVQIRGPVTNGSIAADHSGVAKPMVCPYGGRASPRLEIDVA